MHPIDQPLYVATMLSNPLRWASRYKNYHQFEREMASAGAKLYTAEIAFGQRPFEITEPGLSRHLQLRTTHELWLKENALNLLIQRLPADAKYIAWVDADVQFARPDWAQETIQQLQHTPVVQLFSRAQDMDQGYVPTRDSSHGFAYCYREGIAPLTFPPRPYSGPPPGAKGVYWHPGFAWAARREALDMLGGLMDFCVFGSADWHMAYGLIGQIDATLEAPYTATYRQWVREWGSRAERHIRRDIGYVPGLILHHYHGAKSDRGYRDRYKLVKDFDPVADIRKDTQGLWALDETNLELRDNLRRYARRRREDG